MKKKVDDLAIFGGSRLFQQPLHVGRPNIGNKDHFLSLVSDIVDRKWLSNQGQNVREFEARLAEFLGVKYCIAMCNATIGLEIAIRAVGMKGEVIVPSFTFIATAHALQWQEITPVFCDIDPDTHNIDVRKIEELITPKTSGIIGVSLWGRPCEIDLLAGIAQKHKLLLLFDSAHAFGCSYKGQMIGRFGDAEVFSFHATKFMNTLEGGAIATNNDELAKRIMLMKNFGFTYYDCVDYIGTNGKMNEISAAMGLTNLNSIADFIEKNRSHYALYCGKLKDVPGVNFIKFNQSEKNNYQYVVAEIDEKQTKISRDEILEILHAENILARRYFHPGCHRMEPYKSLYPHARLLLPETEKLCKRVLSFPTGTGISANDVGSICELVSFCVANGPAISKKLSSSGRYHSVA